MGDRRAQLERGWIVVSIAYGGLRAALVWKFLSKYGVNPYLFGIIEFSSAALYGKSSAQVVGAVVDGTWSRLQAWLPVAVVSYFAPDAYVFLSAGHLPSDMLAILISVVCVTLVLTGIGIVAQVRRGHRG
ncbi:MAG: hypothetical protein WCP83_07535 [Actinomycetota bacterium]|jgi:hypothetical protein